MKFLKHSLISFIIVLSMLFSVSCSDSSVSDSNTDQCSVYPGLIAEFDTTHTAGDFQVTVESINLDYTSMGITLTGNNHTDKIASFDKTFDVEKFHNDHWDTCQNEEPEFSEHEKGILENSSAQVTYDWSKYFDIKEPGTYRFKTNIINDATGSHDKNELIIEFTVAYDSVLAVLESYSISEGSALININWNNNSDGNIYLTDVYTVEALNDGKWIECQRTDAEFPLSLFAVASGESAEKHYLIDEMYELTYYGNYRVYLEYAVSNGDETETRCALIEFFIPYEIDIVE